VLPSVPKPMPGMVKLPTRSFSIAAYGWEPVFNDAAIYAAMGE
jgi:hypothetical protein